MYGRRAARKASCTPSSLFHDIRVRFLPPSIPGSRGCTPCSLSAWRHLPRTGAYRRVCRRPARGGATRWNPGSRGASQKSLSQGTAPALIHPVHRCFLPNGERYKQIIPCPSRAPAFLFGTALFPAFRAGCFPRCLFFPVLRTGVAFPRAHTALFSRSPHKVQPFPERARVCSLLSARAWPFPGHTRLCSHVLHTGGILSQGAHRIPFSRPAPVPRDTMCFPSKKEPVRALFLVPCPFFFLFRFFGLCFRNFAVRPTGNAGAVLFSARFSCSHTSACRGSHYWV